MVALPKDAAVRDIVRVLAIEAFKSHIGFYPTPSGITAFQKEIRPYKSSRGAVQFPIDQPLPLPLVKAIVSYRMNENSKKPEQARRRISRA
jgi:uncharacterized protein YdhG (YjbR/CyaY superfamily)